MYPKPSWGCDDHMRPLRESLCLRLHVQPSNDDCFLHVHSMLVILFLGHHL